MLGPGAHALAVPPRNRWWLTAACCLLAVALATSEVVVARQWWSDGDCVNGRFLAPAVWLFWDGIAGLALVGCWLLQLARGAFAPPFDRIAVGLAQLAVVLGCLFAAAWTVVGVVMLWLGEGPPCEPKTLRDGMWAFVMLDLALLAAVAWMWKSESN